MGVLCVDEVETYLLFVRSVSLVTYKLRCKLVCWM